MGPCLRAAGVALAGPDGACAAGHASPFPGGRLTLRPGESGQVTFRSGSYDGFGYGRQYPVTVEAAPGTAPPPAFDLEIDAKASQPADGP